MTCIIPFFIGLITGLAVMYVFQATKSGMNDHSREMEG